MSRTTDVIIPLLNSIKGRHLDIHDVLAIMIYIREKGPIGRYSICKALGIGEGIIRGIISRMRSMSLLNVLRAGVVLSDKGSEVLNNFLNNLGVIKIESLKLTSFTGGLVNLSAQLRPPVFRSMSCIEERDLAVRFGARGAVIIHYIRGRLCIPSVYDDLSKEYPKISRYLFTKFDLSEGDHIVIVFNSSKWYLLRPLMLLTLKLKGYF